MFEDWVSLSDFSTTDDIPVIDLFHCQARPWSLHVDNLQELDSCHHHIHFLVKHEHLAQVTFIERPGRPTLALCIQW